MEHSYLYIKWLLDIRKGCDELDIKLQQEIVNINKGVLIYDVVIIIGLLLTSTFSTSMLMGLVLGTLVALMNFILLAKTIEKSIDMSPNEAKLYAATLVLRGFKDGSYAKTVNALQKIIQETGQGFIIDPELFSLFSATAVPTYVLSRPFQLHALELTYTPLHDRLQGHVSLQYALEMFAKEGDLKEEAHSLLENTQLKRSSSK